MNSNSKIYTDPCSKKHDDNNDSRSKCHRKDEDQEFVLLKVGNPQNTTIPSTSINGNVFTVASLPVKIGCLDDPEIKIDFTANILTGAVPPSLGATIVFQVNKFFINSFNPTTPITVGPTWNYSNIEANESDIIAFFVKDDDEFDGNSVKYTVTATVAGLATSVTNLGGPITVNNATPAIIVAAEKDERK